jgi:hypothetical protein
MDTLETNVTWTLVKLFTRRIPIGKKWVFNKKFNVEGKMEKHKTRSVANGYSQVEELILVRFFALLLS